MNFTKLLNMGILSCRSMLLPAFPTTVEESRAVLAEYWQDVRSSCHFPRPTQWLETAYDISVIVPCYNDAAHVCRGVDSVLSQELDYTLEVIVVNDGSRDNTPELLKKYEALPNVTVIHQENKGLSGARNAGLAVCRGRFILFHDSDDTLLPGSLQALLSSAFRQDADIVAGGYVEETPDGQRTPGLCYSREDLPVSEISGMSCGKVYRRSLFAELCFPVGYWYEDSVISQILFPTAKNVRCITSEVFAYLQNSAGISSTSQGKPKSLDSLYITEQLLQDKALFGLPLDEDAYRHFLYMVVLTYQRTRLLEPRAVHAVFQHQRLLLSRYFPNCRLGTPLEKALLSGNYRRYLRQCELSWLKQRLGR